MRIIGKPLVKPRELNQGGTGTTELVFTSDGTTPVILYLPTAEQLAPASGGAAFCTIRAWGRVTGGTTTNFTAQLQFGTSATPGSNTDIESGAAVAVNSTSGLWWLKWEGVVTTTGYLDGAGTHMIAGSTRTLTALAAQDNAITTADLDGVTAQGFVMTGTFSGGHASNAAYLDGFTLEVHG